MARPNPVRRIMAQPLPGITYQRRKGFRPTDADVSYAYKILNRHIFSNVLTKPEIVQRRMHKTWGICHWNDEEQTPRSYCKIELSDKWFCVQWFLNTLAHEMVHQYQYDIYRWEHLDTYGREMYQNSGGHGPSFFAWRDQFDYYGLTLKTSYGMKRWFRHQNFQKC